MHSLADKIIDLYERHARDWVADRQRAAFVEVHWLERFTAVAGAAALLAGGSAVQEARAGAHVLDIGCGAGSPVGEWLIGKGFDVTGVDSSASMIALCRDRLPNQRWLITDMRKLSLNRTFHGVLAWDSFWHLRHEDQRKMFPVFRQHAAPGAALMFTSGPGHGEAIGTYGGEALYHSSLAAEEYRALLAGNGFVVSAHVAQDPLCGGRTVWLARMDSFE